VIFFFSTILKNYIIFSGYNNTDITTIKMQKNKDIWNGAVIIVKKTD